MHPGLLFRRTPLLALALSVGCVSFVGCGIQAVPTTLGGSPLQGHLRGGQQPVANASIVLYAAGSGGNGLGAQNLLLPHVVMTGGDGGFSISNDYICPSNTTQVYLVASGGNPGLANAVNPALVMMAALGDCGNLSQSTNIDIDEVTTVAAAWSLSQFLGAGAGVGASSTNATGLRNAFLIAANLADTTHGVAPGASLPVGAVTETKKINTLANVLAACVNSNGGVGCQPLFTAATVAGVPPTNTLDAALNIVRNPSAKVSSVFGASSSQPPFLPALAAAPTDWTISITYGNCTSGCGGLSFPESVAVDSTGSVWVANYFGAAVSKFSANGTPAAASGFPGVGLNASYGITVDGQDSAWVTNENSVSAANNHRYGSVSKFTSNGTEVSGAGFTGGGIYYPVAVAADTNGLIWIADHSDSSASVLASDGSAVSGANGYAASLLPFTTAVALDANHNAWFAVQKAVVEVSPQGVATTFPCCSRPAGIALDQSANVWVADYNGSAIVELSSSGTVLHSVDTYANSTAPVGIAVDGAGNIWTANYYGESISELLGSSAAMLSPPSGLGLDASMNEPYGIAVDASGSLWVSNSGGNTLTQFVGLASPVKTPQLGLPAQP